jgi:hypothetical protein
MPKPESVPSTRIDRRHALWVLVLAGATLVPGLGHAQDPFQLSFTVDRSGGGTARVNGRVLNEGQTDVFDVYVTAEAVDGGGKVLGRGITFVGASIPPRGIVPFVISIPAAQTAATFRVRVSSFRHGMGQQAG